MRKVKMANKKIGVLGDVMLDKYTYGRIERISPEAPVPILKVENEEYRLGGACNVANNILSLENCVKLFGIIGRDDSGEILKKLLEKKNLEFYLLEDEKRKTTIKNRFIDLTFSQQTYRVDYEDSFNLEDRDYDVLLENILTSNVEFLIFSDYNKGVASKYLLDNLKKTQLKLLIDPKPVNSLWYKGVYLIKPNRKEAEEMLKKITDKSLSFEEMGKLLAKEFDSNFVITRDGEGSALFDKKGNVFYKKQEKVQVYDVTGAGDTYIATLGFGLYKGLSLKDAMYLAGDASKLVVQKMGTATVNPEELIKESIKYKELFNK